MALLDPVVHTRDGHPTAAPAMLVDGRAVRPAASRDVVDPSTGQVLAVLSSGDGLGREGGPEGLLGHTESRTLTLQRD